jgi:riboflavin synthase
MFTGLIREMATVKRYAGNILSLRAEYRPQVGDSVAVNGVCLTVVKVYPDGFDVELADETRSVIDESRLKGQVHIEPAMQMGDRFEGHIVQGHVDCTGEIVRITPRQNGTDFFIRLPESCMAYVIPKGSITVDGVSLTVNEVYDDTFRLTIIPHTVENTLFRTYRVGSRVNIETDFFARYIEHILSRREQKKAGLSWQEIDAMSLGY